MILVPSFFIVAFMATSSPATPTPANSYEISVSGSSGTLTHSQPVKLDVGVPPPTGFYLSSSPRMQYVRPGNSVNYTIEITSIEGFSLPVNLTTSSLPSDVNVSFNPTSLIPTSTSDFFVTTNLSISEGEHLIEVVATADSITHKLNVTLLVTTTPDFLINVDPYLKSVAVGDSATYSVSLTSVEGFTSPVDFTVNNLPPGSRVTFNRTYVIPNGSAIFTIITIKPVDWSLFWNGIFLSLLIAGIATSIDLLLGIPLAIMIVRGRFRKLGGLVDVLVNIPYIVPTAALGISLGFFYRDLGIQGFDILIVTMAHVAFTFPFVVRNVVGGLEGLDPGYEDTARTLGARPFQTFKRIMFPIVKPSILAGAIMAFTRSIGETGATLAVSNQIFTAPILIVRYTAGAARDLYTAGLLIAIMIIVSSFAILVMRLLTSRRRISA